MDLGTSTATIGYAAGLFDSTESSRKQQVANDLTKSGFSPDQADAIIRAIHAYSGTTAHTSPGPLPPSKKTRFERLVVPLTDSIIPLAVVLTTVICTIAFALFVSA